MDPTAPKDNPIAPPAPTQGQEPDVTPPAAGQAPPAVPSNPWSSQPPTPPDASANPGGAAGPIQTGQFVSVGGDTPAPTPANYTPPVSATLPPLPPTPPSPNGPILGAIPQPSPTPLAPEPPLPATPPADTPFAPNQPNPTPYAPPPNAPDAQSGQGGSKLKSLKLIAIIAGILILVALIGALVWFFIINGKANNQAASTQNTGTDVTGQSPLPKVDKGGFGDLPQATASAQATNSATPSAQSR